jgi:hypothetical protein
MHRSMSTPVTAPTPETLIDDLLGDLVAKAHWLNLSDDEITPFLDLGYPTKEQWDALQPSLVEQEKQRSQRVLHTYLEASVRKKLISDWVERNVDAKEYDKKELKREIDFYVREDRTEDLRVYLSDVLEVGLKKAQSRRKRKQWGDGDYVGHVWEALTGIVRVAIVVGIFVAAQTKFETIVFAMLVMIYYAIYGASSGYLQIIQGVAFGVDNQFKRIRRALKVEIPAVDREIEYEGEQELLKEASRGKVRFWIRAAFFYVIWLVAIWKLVAAVFF